MKCKTVLLTILFALLHLLPACAWDYTYAASMLPWSLPLSSGGWEAIGVDTSNASCSDGVLHLWDATSSASVNLERPGTAPTTMEVSVKVLNAAPSVSEPECSGAAFGLDLEGAAVNLWTDHISGEYRDPSNGDSIATWSSALDLTQFHTIRLAVTSTTFWVWADGSQVFSGDVVGGGQQYLYFGGPDLPDATSDTYWQYVDYSNSFVPVPEPSSLLALVCGIAGVGGIALRRRR